MQWWSKGLTAVALFGAGLCGGCGYHVAGRADLVPKSVNTIAIPPFQNLTTRYRLTDWLPEAISHEFIARTRFRVVSDPGQADAILRGAVVNYTSFPTIFDQSTGRATGLQVNVTLQVSLIQRTTGKVLFNRPSFDAHQRYQIAIDPKQYYEESDSALARLSHDVARDVVSAILENF